VAFVITSVPAPPVVGVTETILALDGNPTAFTYAPTMGAAPFLYCWYARVVDAEAHDARNCCSARDATATVFCCALRIRSEASILSCHAEKGGLRILGV
jgi:hypothetical protein